MPSFKRKRCSRKPRPYPKRKGVRKGGAFVKKVRKIAKATVLSIAETKHTFNAHNVPVNILHNRWALLGPYNLCMTRQGPGDGDTAGDQMVRIGDSVQPRGVKMVFTFNQQFARPNVIYKMIILKSRGNRDITSASIPMKGLTSVKVMDTIDPEWGHARVIATRTWKSRSPTYARHDSLVTHNSNYTFVKRLWIPLKGKYHYSGDDTNTGRDYNLSCHIVAYDEYDTNIDTVLGEVQFGYEFFFKDV